MNNANAFDLYGKYKHLYLFNTGKGSVLFKPLSYNKCETAKRICAAYPALAPVVEDNIWEECVVEHTLQATVDDMNAGLVSTIVRLILGFSNPTSLQEVEDDIQQLRNETGNIRNDIVIKICQAFPAYTPDDVENMEWREQLKRLVQAEKILGTKFQFVDEKSAGKTPAKKTIPGQGPAMKVANDGNQYIDFEKENQLLM